MRTLINPTALKPAHIFWIHPDDLPAIPARERLGALLDRRDATAQALEDALVAALLVEAFGGPVANSAHDVALMRLFQAHLASSKIDHDLRQRWPREVGGALATRQRSLLGAAGLHVTFSTGPRRAPAVGERVTRSRPPGAARPCRGGRGGG